MRYVSGPYTSRQLLDNTRAVEDWITDEFEHRGPITAPADQRSMDQRLRDVSQGRNACIFDDQGNPSIMVRVPMMLLSDLVAGWAEDLHPTFVVNGKAVSELWIGKYQAITTGSGAAERALSLRRRDPRVYVNFDQAVTACSQKGAGWHLMTNAEWAAIALWCKANGFWPRGNNSYGNDYSRTDEWGEVSYIYSGTTKGRTATGTGPATWSHDGSPYGIFDLNGNIYEWAGGMRLVDGEIQILADNNAADNTRDQSAVSTEWKAILQDGSLVEPGTADTLKYDTTAESDGSGVRGTNLVNTSIAVPLTEGHGYNAFQNTSAAVGITVPDLLKQLGLYPVDGDHGSDMHYQRNTGERLPRRGASWHYASDAGVCALSLNSTRSYSYGSVGFRPAYLL
jgi:sulfatase modifying factor 1